MNPNNKPKTFKDQNGKMNQAGKVAQPNVVQPNRVNTQPNQPNKNNNFNNTESSNSYKKDCADKKSCSNNSFERMNKTENEPKKFNNFKK